MNGKYVNEENHQKVKSKLKTGAKIFLAIGIPLLIAGIVLVISGMSSFADFESDNFFTVPFGFILSGIGVFCIFMSITLFVTAHEREIAAFGASSVLPVVNDSVNYLADKTMPAVNRTLGGLAENIAGGISQGIAKGKNANNFVKCENCGKQNDKTAKFCKNCGAELEARKYCTNCGSELDLDEFFCADCGTRQSN